MSKFNLHYMRFVLMGLMAGVLFVMPLQAAVPGVINFQGYLTDSGGQTLPDGSYTMNFFMFDAAIGGNQLWNAPDGEQQTVIVINGIYNIQLGMVEPLDSSVFSGGTAWLEVVVEGETLSPRQRITATAYALKAADADTLAGNSLTDLDVRYIQEGQSGAVTSEMITDGAVTISHLGSNSVGTKQIADGAVLSEILNDDGPGSGLNADYLDSLDSTAFVLTSQDYGRPNAAANLYEGASTLTNRYVNQTGDTMNGQLSINNDGSGLFLDVNPSPGTLFGVHLDVDQSAANNYITYGFYNMANSGAATANLYGNFSAAQKDAGTGLVYGNYQRSRHYGTGGNTYGYYSLVYGSDTGDAYGNYAYASKPSSDTAGNVYGGYFISDNDYDAGMGYGINARAFGAGGTNYGVYGTAYNGNTNYGGYFTTSEDTGIPVVGLQSADYTPSDLSAWEPGGFFGGRNGVIGYTEKDSGYGVHGRATGYNTRGVYGYADGDNAYGAYGSAISNGTGEDDPRGVYGSAIGPEAIGGYFTASGTNAVGVYAYGTEYAAEFNGNVIITSGTTTVMELGTGLDYAEGFDISDLIKPDPGSVLIIDSDHPGKLTLSTTAYDTRVAGIVAGANGLGSGVRLGADQFDNDVALAGRVFCKVDATDSAVKTGDLLTTSGLPGHAMKAGNRDLAHGAILGKAMQDLEKGTKGQILVLVTLH